MSEPRLSLRTRMFQIIFESDTPAAKAFDIALVVLILISVAIVLLDSIPRYHNLYGLYFFRAEWAITVIFTIELGLRLYCLDKPWQYLKSFYGIVDVVAVLPTWLVLIHPSAQALIVVRLLRMVRLLRVLELMALQGEGRLLVDALKRSRGQIFLFLCTVILIVTIFSSLLYLIEPAEAGFTSIPKAIYWGIVTLTTVGYGDIVPVTPLGQFISLMIMLVGYSIIAVPTGVFSAEVIRSLHADRFSHEACPGCGKDRHERDARYCNFCGTWLNENTTDPLRRDPDSGTSD